jgi:26S proteasome regulatory subunit T5
MSTEAKEPEKGKKLEDTGLTEIDPDLLTGTPQDIINRARMIDSQTKILHNEVMLLNQEIKQAVERVKQNAEKIKMQKQLPYLVGHVVEVRFEKFSSVLPFLDFRT